MNDIRLVRHIGPWRPWNTLTIKFHGPLPSETVWLTVEGRPYSVEPADIAALRWSRARGNGWAEGLFAGYHAIRLRGHSVPRGGAAVTVEIGDRRWKVSLWGRQRAAILTPIE